MRCSYNLYFLRFKNPGGTSRGVLKEKETYILRLREGKKTAYGECNLFRGLSYDDRVGYEEKLKEICIRLPEEGKSVLFDLQEWPSIYFGVETLLKDWENGAEQVLFSKSISVQGFSIPTNALIWMGKKEDMMSQLKARLEEGNTSIKLKIGAIDFETELELMRFIRKQFTAQEVEIRVDANGAFGFEEAKEKIKRISEFEINYIEQPIKAGQWQEMAALAENSPVKIALDEELIGIQKKETRAQLVKTIIPQMLILKPALIGGFTACDEWKGLIENEGGSWVITSALESNIGLNAIAQYTALDVSEYAQGLGTGQLYTNNFPSPYTVDAQGLHYHVDKKWDFSLLS